MLVIATQPSRILLSGPVDYLPKSSPEPVTPCSEAWANSSQPPSKFQALHCYSSSSPTHTLYSSSTGLFPWPQRAPTLASLHAFAHSIPSAWKHPPPPPSLHLSKSYSSRYLSDTASSGKAFMPSLSWVQAGALLALLNPS